MKTELRGVGLGVFTYMKNARQTLRAAARFQGRAGVPASLVMAAEDGAELDLRFAISGAEGRRTGFENTDYVPCSALVTPTLPSGTTHSR